MLLSFKLNKFVVIGVFWIQFNLAFTTTTNNNNNNNNNNQITLKFKI
jgi:hypothetical protein